MESIKVEKLEKCRICKSPVELVYNFGDFFVSGFVPPNSEVPKAPLALVRCLKCGLVQLGHTVDLDFLYKKQYWYKSALNNSMIVALKDIVDKAMQKVELTENSVVVDIGTNDSTLLSFYPDFVTKVGYEPASNLTGEHCDYFINDYFSADNYPKVNKAKIITSIAMFYDLIDPNSFVEDIKSILDKDGIWIIQLTDLVSMLKLNEFGNLCHEHLEFYTLLDLIYLFKAHGLEIFDLEYNTVNAGSLRVYICRKGNDKYTNYDIVYTTLKEELNYLFPIEGDRLALFVDTVKENKEKTVELLLKIKETDDIYAIGASTKGNTLLQYYGIDKNIISAIGEVNSDKYGLVTAGLEIPIISEKELFSKNPKYLFLIIWQFENNILNKLKDKIDNGLTVIVPLPKPHVVTKEGVRYL
jgi:hypothetical protein